MWPLFFHTISSLCSSGFWNWNIMTELYKPPEQKLGIVWKNGDHTLVVLNFTAIYLMAQRRLPLLITNLTRAELMWKWNFKYICLWKITLFSVLIEKIWFNKFLVVFNGAQVMDQSSPTPVLKETWRDLWKMFGSQRERGTVCALFEMIKSQLCVLRS